SLCISSYPAPLDLHAFPTRRSSDLLRDDGALERPEGARRDPEARGAQRIDPGGDAGRIAAAGDLRRRDRHRADLPGAGHRIAPEDRKSTRLNSSHEWISYAVFCLKK